MTADVRTGQDARRAARRGRPAPGRAAPAGLSRGRAACGGCSSAPTSLATMQQGRFERVEWPPGGRGALAFAERRVGGPRPGRLRAPDGSAPPAAGGGAGVDAGRPLPDDVRWRLRDVAGPAADALRVHDDGAADALARAHRADAVTVGPRRLLPGRSLPARARSGASRCWPTRPRTSWRCCVHGAPGAAAATPADVEEERGALARWSRRLGVRPRPWPRGAGPAGTRRAGRRRRRGRRRPPPPAAATPAGRRRPPRPMAAAGGPGPGRARGAGPAGPGGACGAT